MKKMIILMLVIAGIAEGCKKYEEGPWISFRSAKNRIFGGYTLAQYTVNGTDSLSLFNDSLGLIFGFHYDEVSYENICSIDRNRKDGNWAFLQFNWELINNNKIFHQIKSVGDKGTGPFGEGKNDLKWEILRLTNKEVKMKTNFNTKEYLIMLETVKF